MEFLSLVSKSGPEDRNNAVYTTMGDLLGHIVSM